MVPSDFYKGNAISMAIGITIIILMMVGQVDAAIDVTPDRNTEDVLMGNIKLKVADSDTLRFYFAVDVTEEMIADQLVIDVPQKAMAGDNIKIKVTAGSAGIGNATINISNDTSITDKNGILNYTLPRNLNGTYFISASKTGFVKATKNIEISNNLLEIQCLPDESDESLISRNIVIVIDNSGSTGFSYSSMGTESRISLIHANAISVIRSIGKDSRVGVAAFGNNITNTSMLPMNNETNKGELEKFISNLKPKIDESTDLDKGLRRADELLNSVTGTKEIIIISDGFLNPKRLTQTKNTVLDLQNKETKIQFVQILFPEEARMPADDYDKLAKAAGTDVILLYPDERLSTFIELVPPKEQCSAKAYDTMTVTITEPSGKGNPIEGAEVSFDGMIVGMTNNTGKIDYIFISSGLHNITATKIGYETVVKMVQVLPAPNITLNPTAIISQTPNTDLLLKNEVKEVEEPLNKIEGFENKSSWLESTIRSIHGWFKSIF